MAGTKISSYAYTVSNILSAGPQQKAFVAAACRKYNLPPPELFDTIKMTERPFDNTVVITLVFKPMPMPDQTIQDIGRVRGMLNHDFRGPIIRAAVPELAAALDRLLSSLGNGAQPTMIDLTERMVRELMENINGTKFDSRFRY